jgi:hypothetical protein
VKEIKLHSGHITVVDDEDYDWLTQNFSFHLGGGGYVRTCKLINGLKTSIALHNIIIGHYQEIPKDKEVDHIDHNPLNNCKSNLNVVTHRENCQNRARKRNPICPKCKERKKYKFGSYCLPCHLEYMKERRKNNPEIRAKETQYKRDYRKRLKEGTVLKKDE